MFVIAKFTIFALMWPYAIIETVITTLGVLLFSCFIVYDTQLMLIGKHKYTVGTDE